MSQMTIQVEQSLLQNPELKILRIRKILTICDKNKIQKIHEKSRKGCDIWQKQGPLQLTKFYFAS